MPSFKKSLIVEKFQGNYLKLNRISRVFMFNLFVFEKLIVSDLIFILINSQRSSLFSTSCLSFIQAKFFLLNAKFLSRNNLLNIQQFPVPV